MTCDEARTLVTIGAFGTLDDSDRQTLDEHLHGCPACARAAERTAGVRGALDVPEDLPLPNWERSWEVIASRSLDRAPRFWMGPAFRGWAAAAAAIVVFVLGLLAGRGLPLRSRPAPADQPADAGTVASSLDAPSPLQRYAESLEPVLVSFADRGAAAPSPEAAEARRRLLRSMIEDTRALRKLAAQAGDAELEELFGEMEPLLMSIANLRPGDRSSIELLNRVIRGHELRSRVRQLAGKGATS